MRLLGKPKLEKLKRKNKGNKKLIDSIERLIIDIEENNWSNQLEVKESRPDADCIHSDGFYFFNINVHRTMILIEFDDSEATVVWVGTHSQYETTFKNNKAIIEKWLRANEYIN